MHASVRDSLTHHLCLLALLSLILIPLLTHAQPISTDPKPTLDIPPHARGRVFSASTESPIANTFSKDPDVVEATATIIEYFDTMATIVNRTMVANRGHEPRQNKTFLVCNNRSISWRNGVVNSARQRGWSVDPTRHCITDIYGIPAEFHLKDFELDELAERRGKRTDKLNGEILKVAGLSNWTVAQLSSPTGFHRGTQKCTIRSLSGTRVGGLWYNPVGITNRPPQEWLPDGKRQYLTEHVRAEGGRLVTAVMKLPVNPVEGTVHEVETKSTTVLLKWSGAVEASQFIPVDKKENLALKDALDKGDHYQQQVEGATTPSNVAILALPLVLSLVPLGLITDVRRKRMLVYVLLSDVLTALPMWIKGVELIEISKRRFTSAVTRVGDVSVDDDIAVSMETWIASCRSEDNVRYVGLTFILVATLLMVVGIVLEIVIQLRQRAKRKAKMGQYEALLEEYDGEKWLLSNG